MKFKQLLLTLPFVFSGFTYATDYLGSVGSSNSFTTEYMGITLNETTYTELQETKFCPLSLGDYSKVDKTNIYFGTLFLEETYRLPYLYSLDCAGKFYDKSIPERTIDGFTSVPFNRSNYTYSKYDSLFSEIRFLADQQSEKIQAIRVNLENNIPLEQLLNNDLFKNNKISIEKKVQKKDSYLVFCTDKDGNHVLFSGTTKNNEILIYDAIIYTDDIFNKAFIGIKSDELMFLKQIYK